LAGIKPAMVGMPSRSGWVYNGLHILVKLRVYH